MVRQGTLTPSCIGSNPIVTTKGGVHTSLFSVKFEVDNGCRIEKHESIVAASIATVAGQNLAEMSLLKLKGVY